MSPGDKFHVTHFLTFLFCFFFALFVFFPFFLHFCLFSHAFLKSSMCRKAKKRKKGVYKSYSIKCFQCNFFALFSNLIILCLTVRVPAFFTAAMLAVPKTSTSISPIRSVIFTQSKNRTRCDFSKFSNRA